MGKLAKIDKSERKLTVKQEKLVYNLVSGMPHGEAYRLAYPNSESATAATRSARSYQAMKLPHMARAYDELMAEIREEEKQKILWAREQHNEKLLWALKKIEDEVKRKTENIETEAHLIETTRPKGMSQSDADIAAAVVRQKQVWTSAMSSGVVSACESLSKANGVFDIDLSSTSVNAIRIINNYAITD